MSDGHVDLLAAHDAEVDHGLPGSGVEGMVGRSPVGLLQRGHQVVADPLVLDPAEELPDRPEVVDVVDERRAGQRHQQRPRDPAAHPLGDLDDLLRALRLLVLDVVRLVDHHAAEAVLAHPADVTVEHLVVDHHDVGEAVDRVAVTVDHRHRAVGSPACRLARPVGLHHVGDDAEQRIGAGDLRGEQRLRRLAEAGLVGQQEGPVTLGDRGQHLRLVGHQLEVGRQHQLPLLGQLHAGRGARDRVLEGVEDGADQVPADQPADRLGLRGRAVVGDQERVGELGRHDRLRDHPPLGPVAGRVLLRRKDGFLGDLEPGGLGHLALPAAGALGDLGVLLEEVEERRVAGRDLGEDLPDAVEAAHQVVALALAHLGVGLHPRALLAREQRDRLVARVVTRRHLPTRHRVLHLAHGLGQHGHQALLVPFPGRGLSGTSASAGPVLTPAGQPAALFLARLSRRERAVRGTSRPAAITDRGLKAWPR